MRKQFRHLSDLDDALEVLSELAIEPASETVSLAEANGRILAESIVSEIDVPGFDRSIMDGFAVRGDDTVGAYDDDPVELAAVGEVVPGEVPDVTIEAGEAAEIATGAMLPDGADAVVKVEDTTRDGDTVSIFRPAPPQEHVMSRGADIPAGGTVLRRGDRLDAQAIGLLAAIGIDEVAVTKRPTVGIISTGNELVRPTEADHLEVGEIFDINSFSMAAAIEEAGASASIYPHAEDEYDVIRRTFEDAAAECDLVVSSGSTSASAEDVVYRIVEDAGELLLHGIAVKPGKPTVFGRIDGTPVLGMPGNPISALMNFRLFVRPLLAGALGERASGAKQLDATVATAMDSVGGRTQLSPVGLIEDPDRGLLAYGVDKGSGAITSLADADGYLTIPVEVHYVAADETASVTLLDDAHSTPAVLLCGDPCPVLDGTIDRCDVAVRYLDVGSADGMRKLRDGIADLAAIGAPTSELATDELEEVSRYRGYDRQLGLLHRGERTLTELTHGTTVATLPRQTGLARHLTAIIDDRGWDISVRNRPSHAGLIEAVETGEVAAAFTLETMSNQRDLAFEPINWEPLDLFIADNRREKGGVDRLLNAIDDRLVEERPGIRRPENHGERISRY